MSSDFHIRPLAFCVGKNIRHIAAASAYQCRTRLRAGARVFDFSDRQSDLVAHGILLPDNAPSFLTDRQLLCDALHFAPRFTDGLVARWLVADFDPAMTAHEMVQGADDFCRGELVAAGICVDYAVHDPRQISSAGQPHLHAILSAHEVGPDGFGTYRKDWQSVKLQHQWRHRWLKIMGLQS